MSEVFVLRNQHGEYLNKQREWLACGDSKTLFRSTQRDELLNEKVELTVKSPDLRIKIIEAEQAQSGRITVDEEDCLPREAPKEESEGQMDLMATSETGENQATAEPALASPPTQENTDNVLDPIDT